MSSFRFDTLALMWIPTQIYVRTHPHMYKTGKDVQGFILDIFGERGGNIKTCFKTIPMWLYVSIMSEAISDNGILVTSRLFMLSLFSVTFFQVLKGALIHNLCT